MGSSPIVSTKPSLLDGNNGQVCWDANTGAQDAYATTVDFDTIANHDVPGVSQDIADVRGQVANLKADFSTFQSDEANIPGYQSQDPPTQDQVAQAAKAANVAVAAAVSRTNADVVETNAADAAAYNYAAVAQQAGSCGGVGAADTPIDHIS